MNKKIIIAGLLMVSAIFFGKLVFDLASTAPISAQGDPLPLPTIQMTDVPIPSEKLREIEEDTAEFSSHSIFNYRIAYLSASDVPPVMSPQQFQNSTGSQLFNNWEQFLAEASVSPFDVIIIDNSAKSWVQSEHTQVAYKNNSIIVGLGLSKEEMNIVTGDNCLSNGVNPVSSHTNIMYFYTVVAEETANISAIHDAYLQSCTENVENVGKHGVTQGYYLLKLTSEEDLQYFNQVLFTTLYSTRSTRVES
jgi:hypothetical protein